MRYIVVGAGAVGASIGARLFQSGVPEGWSPGAGISNGVQQAGLDFLTPADRSTLPIPAVAGPAEVNLAPDDVPVCAVKGQDTAAALVPWADRFALAPGSSRSPPG